MIRTPRRSGFLIAEALLAVIIGAITVVIGTKLIFDSINLQHLAAGHDNRQIVQAAISAHLRTDLLAATSFQWQSGSDGAALHLFDSVGTGPQIIYEFQPAAVTRRTPDGGESIWTADRLNFHAERKTNADPALLRLTFIEIPPARATILPNRKLEMTFVLPLLEAKARSALEVAP